jgi:hypothetical protein
LHGQGNKANAPLVVDISLPMDEYGGQRAEVLFEHRAVNLTAEGHLQVQTRHHSVSWK